MIYFGLGCCWWGDEDEIEESGSAGGVSGLVKCPNCGEPLGSTPSDAWWNSVERIALNPEYDMPDYREFIVWLKGRDQCWPSLSEARAFWKGEPTGGDVRQQRTIVIDYVATERPDEDLIFDAIVETIEYHGGKVESCSIGPTKDSAR